MSTHGDNVPVTVTAVMTGEGVTPPGLYPGPVADGVQTYYGPKQAVPEGWQYRPGDNLSWDPDPLWAPECIVQCRPAPPRTESIPWQKALEEKRRLPGCGRVGAVRWTDEFGLTLCAEDCSPMAAVFDPSIGHRHGNVVVLVEGEDR